jgi:ABC-type sulfate transport system substrate-binding protein
MIYLKKVLFHHESLWHIKCLKQSVFCGIFHQSPGVDYIKYSKVHQFESESASHYILNFQYSKDNQTFRAETYYKAYDNLVNTIRQRLLLTLKYIRLQRVWIFFGDGKTIKNLEYWLSYSYIDTKETYKNFPTTATLIL